MTLHDYKLAAPCYLLLRDGRECTLCVGSTVPVNAVRYRCVKGSVTGSLVCALEQAAHKNLYRRGIEAFIVPSDSAAQYLAASGAIESGAHTCSAARRGHPRGTRSTRRRSAATAGHGTAGSGKGVANLIEAWSRAALPAPWELVVAGDGSEREALEQRASGLRVRFLGHLDEGRLVMALRRASAVAVPTLFPETFGLAPAEAMAHGIPTLVSDVGNLPDLVGNPAQTVPAHDVDAWCDAITWIARSRRERLELGRAGRDRIRRSSDPLAASRAVDAVYEAVRRRPRAGRAQ